VHLVCLGCTIYFPWKLHQEYFSPPWGKQVYPLHPLATPMVALSQNSPLGGPQTSAFPEYAAVHLMTYLTTLVTHLRMCWRPCTATAPLEEVKAQPVLIWPLSLRVTSRLNLMRRCVVARANGVRIADASVGGCGFASIFNVHRYSHVSQETLVTDADNLRLQTPTICSLYSST